MEYGSTEGFVDPSDLNLKQEVRKATPEKCGDCAVQCVLGERLAEYLLAKHFMTSAAEGLVGESGEAFSALVGEILPHEIAGEFVQETRQLTARNLDGLDEAIQAARGDMEDFGDSCQGPLKLRATLDGVTYTVGGICRSPQLPGSGDEDLHLPTHTSTS